MCARMRLRSMTPLFILATLVVALAGPAPGAAAAASADLGLTMTAQPTVVSVGGTTTFTVVVSNNGPHKAKSITVSDPFGIGWTDLSCAADHAGVCRPYRYGYLVTFASLARGDVATITFGATVKGSIAGGNTVTNTASVSAATYDPNGANDSANASVQIQ
jgi:uncharacterized repeat protein (TIGR01451 family)